ncbi:hypothetical protein T439DRAFT_360897 [Meredithblackwellia eburnea MCA 4105]
MPAKTNQANQSSGNLLITAFKFLTLLGGVGLAFLAGPAEKETDEQKQKRLREEMTKNPPTGHLFMAAT